MKGYIQVYTGNGKGKTTAALGMAFRAAGRGFMTYIAQFLKGQPTGEVEAAKKLAPLIRIERFGREGFITVKDGPGDEDVALARKGLECAREAMLSGAYRIVVLDLDVEIVDEPAELGRDLVQGLGDERFETGGFHGRTERAPAKGVRPPHHFSMPSRAGTPWSK